eukprot:1869912-Alexandrium_andersonii.AAC.1
MCIRDSSSRPKKGHYFALRVFRSAAKVDPPTFCLAIFARPHLMSGAPNFCRFPAAERAVRPVGRAGAVTSRDGSSGPGQV